MAFLDNSGDIILDAVLTDIGRKRMAQGDFRISKFAIGDDEIDYGLYNKDHPSGSAYYDLEILQTPVLEAFTQTNANINYGLTSLSMFDLLYLPSIAINTKSDIEQLKLHTNGVIYLAANQTDGSTTVSSALATDLGASTSIMLDNSGDSGGVILLETGINNAEITPTPTNQGSYINSKGLQDNNFKVTYDSRFIGAVFGPTATSYFRFNSGDTGVQLSYTLENAAPGEGDTIIADFHTKNILGLTNRVYYASSAGSTDDSLSFSEISGPRASFTVLRCNILSGIAQSDYVKYGKTGQTQGSASSSKQYDYIDTTIYVTGTTTNLSIQIPIRIIKFAAS